jgi:hypothetical protein
MSRDNKKPEDLYLSLMKVVRYRIDFIRNISDANVDDFGKSELKAFHGRKIIEAIAFSCLIAMKKSFVEIPKDAENQYNAEKIFKTLVRKGVNILHSPSELREATLKEKEDYKSNVVCEGIPERRISIQELIKKYQRMHNWLHELNPYTRDEQEIFHLKNKDQLTRDLDEIESFLTHHFISIQGQGIYCTLKDKNDGLVKIISLYKEYK